jgi:hypothetical protein
LRYLLHPFALTRSRDRCRQLATRRANACRSSYVSPSRGPIKLNWSFARPTTASRRNSPSPRLASTHLFSPPLSESANAACAQVCEPHHRAISTSLTARRERPLSKLVADKSKNQKIITRHTQRGILVIKRNENERLNFFLTFPEFFSKINYLKFGQMPLSVRL